MPDTQPSSSPDPATFRSLMGHFPTGVCVVALDAPDGSVAAMTINSFVSVSLEPLLVCWSLHNSSGRFDLFSKAQRFSISVLAQGQHEKAITYASRADYAVRDGDFARSASGLPVIQGAIAHFECSAHAQHPAGDHTMLVGEVTGLSELPAEDDQALAFYKGIFSSAPKA
ncbi:flavin reductase family protein [Erythrobacter sp. SCSIO 43205]|uniref:flavin reductase family protein n=1 Tax=Erythrobacter sp. SCSIO 43205 TaxID=2779361 RepID=UPI001CA8F82D|nr:flavin reductase family protein [Erythrobacter sp. SCSIO 43205]UAB78756.1 flavin reductase family protein [Erythrobacter sp. SCSIO 43205]